MSDDRRIHDYRQRYFSHDFALRPHEDPRTADITGWGDGVRQHDLLVIPGPDSGACLYEIETIRRPGDPPDMWSTTCRFVPCSSELGQRAIAALHTCPAVSPFGLTSWQVLND